MTWEKIQNLEQIKTKKVNILISTYEEYETKDSSMKYDFSNNNEKIAQNKNKIDTEKKEEENLCKEHKIETKKEIGEKRNIKILLKKAIINMNLI